MFRGKKKKTTNSQLSALEQFFFLTFGEVCVFFLRKNANKASKVPLHFDPEHLWSLTCGVSARSPTFGVSFVESQHGAKIHAVFFFNGHLKYQTHVFALRKVSCPRSDPRKFIFCFYIKFVSTPFQLKKTFSFNLSPSEGAARLEGVVYWGEE